MAPNRWLFLIHQLPLKPDYLRVKIRRRLQHVGAIALKNSVYVLPNREDTAEDFEWLLREIEAEGGSATLVEGFVLYGLSDAELEGLFNADRERDYAEIMDDAKRLGTPERAADSSADAPLSREGARLRARLEEVGKLDFFGAAGRGSAESAVNALNSRDTSAADTRISQARHDIKGKTWVTREGIFVDRMSSAWLIRRFIDRTAKFKFVAGRAYKPESGELRFDMYRAEFTHEGENCTFETLLKKFGLDSDPALVAIGEIVHDIDYKDDKYGRSQTPGVRTILRGLAESSPNDKIRLDASKPMFDGLYTELSSSAGPSLE
jgi:hypothetical protein